MYEDTNISQQNYTLAVFIIYTWMNFNLRNKIHINTLSKLALLINFLHHYLVHLC